MTIKSNQAMLKICNWITQLTMIIKCIPKIIKIVNECLPSSVKGPRSKFTREFIIRSWTLCCKEVSEVEKTG